MRAAPSESAATPRTSTGTGSPASRAACRQRLVAGSTLTTAHAPGEPGGLPADEAAAARRDDDRVERAGLLLQLAAHRALAGDDVGVVVGVHQQRAGLALRGSARGLGVVVVALDDVHVGAERGDAVALHRRAGGRHEDLGPVTEARGDVGDGGAVVTAGGGDEAGGGHVGSATPG